MSIKTSYWAKILLIISDTILLDMTEISGVIEDPTRPLESSEKPTSIMLGFSRVDLDDLLEQPAWKELTPNYQNQNALLPTQLTPDDIISIVTRVADPSTLALYARDQNVTQHVIDGIGTLQKVGAGEEKAGYRLTTPDGKSLIVLLQRSYNRPIEIPKDSRIYNRWGQDDSSEVVSAYSDFRTYLSLPFTFGDRKFGIHLQEDGGVQANGRPPASLEKETIRRVFNYVTPKGLSLMEPFDFGKTDHYLKTSDPTHPIGVIDITLTNRYGDEDEVRQTYARHARQSPTYTGALYNIATAPKFKLPFLSLPKLPNR